MTQMSDKGLLRKTEKPKISGQTQIIPSPVEPLVQHSRMQTRVDKTGLRNIYSHQTITKE